MKAGIHVRGIKELEKTFRNLPRSARKKALRAALRAGANIVKNAAKANVRQIATKEPTGTLEKNISIYNAKDVNGKLRNIVQVKRGALHPSKKRKGEKQRVAEYAAVLEFGKANQPPRSWIRKAAREKTAESLVAITTVAREKMSEAIEDAKR